MVSEKQLVKHLQKEVARLEAELRTPDPSNEKDLKIRQVSSVPKSCLKISLIDIVFVNFSYFCTYLACHALLRWKWRLRN